MTPEQKELCDLLPDFCKVCENTSKKSDVDAFMKSSLPVFKAAEKLVNTLEAHDETSLWKVLATRT